MNKSPHLPAGCYAPREGSKNAHYPHGKTAVYSARCGDKVAKKYIIGIDEVGRGSLAGPVHVAAVMVPDGLKLRGIKDLPKLRDSKKLSARARARWFAYIKKHPQIKFAVASLGQAAVDRINISKAANLAATKAFEKLVTKHRTKRNDVTKVFLDGGLYISSPLVTNHYSLATIIKGDEKIPAISLASIAAKVTRDALMTRLHGRYPQYGFAAHKGYGTKKHFTAIKKYGLSDVHRVSFCG